MGRPRGRPIYHVISISGSVLVFENEIDRALNRSTAFVTPGAQPLPIETLIARVQRAR